MKDLMTTGLDRKWWFAGILSFLSAVLTLTLLDAAGLPSPENWAQWLLHSFCFYNIWRILSFVGWFALLLIAPDSKLLDPAKR